MKRLLLLTCLLSAIIILSTPRPVFAFCFTPSITDYGGCLDQCQCDADWCYADASTWSDRYACHQAQSACNQDCRDFFPN